MDLFDSKEEAMNFIINMNRTFFLDRKEHIKNYYKIRKIHSDVTSSMENYILSGKLPVEEYFREISDDVKRETKNMEVILDTEKNEDLYIFYDLFIYKNHYKIPSLIEIYIKNKKFKDSNKIKMLYAMRNSVVGLFKVIKCDHLEGYVTYQDVFTNKKYKIIDVSMSSLEKISRGNEIYIYNRIINYDGILFGTGIPCFFKNENKRLKKFIKQHKYNSCSHFSRCLMLYDISKDKKYRINAMNYHDF